MENRSLLDDFGISLEEILTMQSLACAESLSDKGQLSRLVTAQRTQDKGSHIAEQLWECKNILSKMGVYRRILLSQQLTAQPTWEQILDQIYQEPMAVRNRTIWLLFHACLQAERDFALEVCPAHSREDVLTGKLIEGISGACKIWATSARSFLNRVKNVLEISCIDLTVGGGEQKTGGDFALILDIKDIVSCQEDLDPSTIALTGGPRGDIFVPLVFQAKCYTGSKADISQKHETRGYQFNRLRQLECAANYIFYENGEMHIETPALPMVKSVSACAPIENNRTTDVFERGVDFATYILRAANGFQSIPAANTREDALNMILANTSPDTVSRVAILGNTSGLDKSYTEALQQLRAEIENEMNADVSQDEGSKDKNRTRFKP